jgi:predicted acylesterase/phospholipase RssA
MAMIKKKTISMKKGLKTALVLQGGGALGAYEVGVAKRLYKEEGFAPHVLGGVSIGAINATALAASPKDPIATLDKLWEQFEVIQSPLIPDAAERMLSRFGNQGFYRMRMDYYQFPFWTNFYDVEPLREVLEASIDFDYLNSPKAPDLILLATNISTGQLTVFKNKQKDYKLSAKHVMASGSLPPSFPMTEIDSSYYWDGGLFSNTPLSPVVDAMIDDIYDNRRIFVVNLFPNNGKIPENMMEVFDRVFEIIFSNKIIFDVNTMNQVNQYVDTIQAIDEALNDLPKAERDRIRNMDGYKRLINFKCIRDVVLIQNLDPELVSGPSDFSHKTLARRMKSGYRDASQALDNLKAKN